MRKFLILFIAITLCGSSLLFSATREEARAYYENKYSNELERYRRTGDLWLLYDEHGDRKALNFEDIMEWNKLMELGLFDDYTIIKLADFDEVPVLWEDYYFIQDMLEGIYDAKERYEVEVKIASALSFSRNFGLPFRCALENQEEIAEMYSKVRYQPTPTTGRKIADNIRAAFDDDYVTTEEKAEHAAITMEEFKAYIKYLKDNYFELDI